MTDESSSRIERRFVPNVLPWVVGAAALAVYLVTLNYWVSLSNLTLVSRVNGWTWQPMLMQPLLGLLTLPFRMLPAAWVPLALNLFTAVCAVLTLVTLARSVALLPHDRLEEQRVLVQNEHALLSVPDAWVPVVLATVQQMDVQTFFFRRKNLNALGQPRSWTDHLLWHHAAHTVDLFAYQARSPIVKANAVQGPIHPNLGIAMDMSIQLKAASGAICTLSLSFNNDGPLGTFFRYIGDSGTYIARYDELVNGKDEKIDVSNVDVSMNGIELQDREFFAAIREGREPNASAAQVLPCYEVLHDLERQLAQG